jgi:hypothetical protein
MGRSARWHTPEGRWLRAQSPITDALASHRVLIGSASDGVTSIYLLIRCIRAIGHGLAAVWSTPRWKK